MIYVFFGTCSTTYSIDDLGPMHPPSLHPHYFTRHAQILVVLILVTAATSAIFPVDLIERPHHWIGCARSK